MPPIADHDRIVGIDILRPHEMRKEVEFLRSKGTVARYSVEKGQPHRLDTLAGANARTRCDLLFMHFLPAGMQEVSEWKNWERLFSVPGLTAAIR